jgi:hypothetical protein
MIELIPVVEPVLVNCPYCDFPIFVVGPHTTKLIGPGKWIHDSDSVPNLPKQTKGQYVSLCTASRPCCSKTYLMIEAALVDAEPEWGSDFTETFFCENRPLGTPTHFMASRGKQAWLVRSYESPLGPVLSHSIGPVALSDWSDEIEPMGCRATGDAWGVCNQIVAGLWDDLIALQKDFARGVSA